ncbi:hypothetical protein T439DRAFT_356723 [Meredithblackwellia eburnea MCA 4105]
MSFLAHHHRGTFTTERRVSPGRTHFVHRGALSHLDQHSLSNGVGDEEGPVPGLQRRYPGRVPFHSLGRSAVYFSPAHSSGKGIGKPKPKKRDKNKKTRSDARQARLEEHALDTLARQISQLSINPVMSKHSEQLPTVQYTSYPSSSQVPYDISSANRGQHGGGVDHQRALDNLAVHASSLSLDPNSNREHGMGGFQNFSQISSSQPPIHPLSVKIEDLRKLRADCQALNDRECQHFDFEDLCGNPDRDEMSAEMLEKWEELEPWRNLCRASAEKIHKALSSALSSDNPALAYASIHKSSLVFKEFALSLWNETGAETKMSYKDAETIWNDFQVTWRGNVKRPPLGPADLRTLVKLHLEFAQVLLQGENVMTEEFVSVFKKKEEEMWNERLIVLATVGGAARVCRMELKAACVAVRLGWYGKV